MPVNISINTNTIAVQENINHISVNDPNNPNIVDITQPVTQIVEIITAGPQGPPGPTGSTGSTLTGGTNNYIPLWSGSTDLTSSTLYQLSGSIGIGTTTPSAKLDVSGSLTVQGNPTSLQYVTVDNDLDLFNSQIETNNYGTYARLRLFRASGTQLSPTTPSTGTAVGRLEFGAYDIGTSTFIANAKIEASMDATTGANDLPSRLSFFTTPDGSSTMVERMRLNNAGFMRIGGTAMNISDVINVENGSIAFENGYGLRFQNSLGSPYSTVYSSNDNTVIKSLGTGIVFKNRTGNNDLITVLDGGNVGIGTGLPNAKLDVNGNAIITGSLTVTNGITGSLLGTASYATQALSASYAATASYSRNLQISGSINSVDYIDFNTGSVVTQPIPGRLSWNDVDGTLDIGLKGGNVTLQIGQEEVTRVVNKTADDLLEADYSVVRIRSVAEGGAQGGRLAVVLALADSDADSATTLGVVTENIAKNQEGFITLSGQVKKINTTGALQGETWVDGDVLYLSSTIPGCLTNIKPTAPNHLVIVGFVEYAHNNQGKIFVKIDNGYELDELHNVRINTGSLTSGQLLVRSGSVWTNSNQLTGSYVLTGSLNVTQGITGSLLGTSNNQPLTLVTSGSERLRITSTGNVGIGTTTPSASLDVAGVVRGVYQADPFSGTPTAKFLSYAPSPYGIIFRGYQTGVHSIQSQREAVNAEVYGLSLQPNGGNVGIGTITPASKLSIAGSVQVADDTSIASSTNVGSIRYRTSGNNSYVDMVMQTGALTYAWVNILQNNW
jgi:hypothetical protein